MRRDKTTTGQGILKIDMSEIGNIDSKAKSFFTGDPVEAKKLLRDHFSIDWDKSVIIESRESMDTLVIASKETVKSVLAAWWKDLKKADKKRIAKEIARNIPDFGDGEIDVLEHWHSDMKNIMAYFGEFDSSYYSLQLYMEFEGFIVSTKKYKKAVEKREESEEVVEKIDTKEFMSIHQEITESMPEFLTAFGNIIELGYAADRNPQKDIALDLLGRIGEKREEIMNLDGFNEVFINGLDSIPCELDWNDTKENLGSKIEDLLKGIKADVEEYESLFDRNMEKEVIAWLRIIQMKIGIDRPENFDYMVEFMVNDVENTADELRWHDGDIAIAYRRMLETIGSD